MEEGWDLRPGEYGSKVDRALLVGLSYCQNFINTRRLSIKAVSYSGYSVASSGLYRAR
jgi:hypothetical protein